MWIIRMSVKVMARTSDEWHNYIYYHVLSQHL